MPKDNNQTATMQGLSQEEAREPQEAGEHEALQCK